MTRVSDATIHAAVTAVVTDDAEIRSKVGRFVKLAISVAEHDLRTGSPAVRATLIRSVVPAMVKAMTVDDSPDEHAELRAQFSDLMAEIRQGVYNPAPPEPEVDVPVDAPPAKKAPVKKTAKKAGARAT